MNSKNEIHNNPKDTLNNRNKTAGATQEKQARPNDLFHPPWMEDEAVKSIDPRKLEFLSRLFAEGHGHGRSQKEMMAYLMPMMRRAKQEHLAFTPQELNAAITAIRKYSTQEELKQIDTLLSRNLPNKQQ